MLDLYKNIKMCRLSRGWSQTDLANKVGYSDKSMISKIEKGAVDLSQSQIIRFAEVFSVSPADLFGDTDAPAAAPQTTPDQEELMRYYDALNDEGQAKVRDYAADLVAGGRYGKDADELSAAYATRDRA